MPPKAKLKEKDILNGALEEVREKGSRPTASRNSLERSLTKKIQSHRTAIRTWRRCFRKKASRFRAERWQNTGMKCISCPLPNGRDINFGTSPKGLSIYLLT